MTTDDLRIRRALKTAATKWPGTERGLAERSGVDASHLWRVLNDRRKATENVARQLLGALEAARDDLDEGIEALRELFD